jgi:hypothetical protein
LAVAFFAQLLQRPLKSKMVAHRQRWNEVHANTLIAKDVQKKPPGRGGGRELQSMRIWERTFLAAVGG